MAHLLCDRHDPSAIALTFVERDLSGVDADSGLTSFDALGALEHIHTATCSAWHWDCAAAG